VAVYHSWNDHAGIQLKDQDFVEKDLKGSDEKSWLLNFLCSILSSGPGHY
jgi:hypothetical protein